MVFNTITRWYDDGFGIRLSGEDRSIATLTTVSASINSDFADDNSSIMYKVLIVGF